MTDKLQWRSWLAHGTYTTVAISHCDAVTQTMSYAEVASSSLAWSSLLPAHCWLTLYFTLIDKHKSNTISAT